MSIKQWPVGDRPRERLFQLGPEALSDTELIALLIASGSGSQGLTALDCARMLLQQFDSLRSLTGASTTELLAVPGIGPGKAARIISAMEIAKRTASLTKVPGSRFKDSHDVFLAYSARLRDEKQEVFLLILLDTKYRFICDKKISLGTLNHSIVHPREVFLAAIRESSAAVILVHNHPSGDPSPSEEDSRLTWRMARAGNLLGIQVLDHIVVGEGRYYSFCDEKRLTEG